LLFLHMDFLVWCHTSVIVLRHARLLFSGNRFPFSSLSRNANHSVHRPIPPWERW
jgi:hypothetical protein